MIDFKNRTLSSFNLSVGTGLMFESIFQPTSERIDVERVVEKMVNLKNYNFHFINLSTLARNIINALQGSLNPSLVLADKEFLFTLKTEVDIIKELYSNTNCEPVFYFVNYDKLFSVYNAGKYKHGEVRAKTKPILENELIYKRLKKINFKKEWSDLNPLEDLLTLPKIEKTKKMLLTSHYVCDYFTDNFVTLVDSHTGRIIERDKFYTKYKKLGSNDMSVFPFYEQLLYFLGDSSMVMIINHKMIRTILYNLAVSKKWTQKTSFSSVRDVLLHTKELSVYYHQFKPIKNKVMTF